MIKKKNFFENLKPIVVLAVIALISGLLLSGVNILTMVDDEKILMEKIADNYDSKIKSQLVLTNNTLKEGSVTKAYLTEDNAIIMLAKSSKAYGSGGLTLMIIIKDNIILKVLSYQSGETPGIGAKLLSDSYLSKYHNVNISKINVFSLTTDSGSHKIDSVTGATKTADGIIIAVNAAVKYYKSMV